MLAADATLHITSDKKRKKKRLLLHSYASRAHQEHQNISQELCGKRPALQLLIRNREGEMHRPFAKGEMRYVARGIYTSGKRKNQACVIKWFRAGHVDSSTFFKYDIKAVGKALDVIKKFNSAGIVNQHIRLNVPDVWAFGAEAGYLAGKKVLVEPFIENFRKWNSNTGWNNSSVPWGRVMQALSHYSYYISNGNFLLCDLQGGFYSQGAVVTDPVICSRTKSYGLTDMGKDGISSFFARHKCNEFCRRHWTKPKKARAILRRVKSTTMRNARH